MTPLCVPRMSLGRLGKKKSTTRHGRLGMEVCNRRSKRGLKQERPGVLSTARRSEATMGAKSDLPFQVTPEKWLKTIKSATGKDVL